MPRPRIDRDGRHRSLRLVACPMTSIIEPTADGMAKPAADESTAASTDSAIRPLFSQMHSCTVAQSEESASVATTSTEVCCCCCSSTLAGLSEATASADASSCSCSLAAESSLACSVLGSVVVGASSVAITGLSAATLAFPRRSWCCSTSKLDESSASCCSACARLIRHATAAAMTGAEHSNHAPAAPPAPADAAAALATAEAEVALLANSRREVAARVVAAAKASGARRVVWADAERRSATCATRTAASIPLVLVGRVGRVGRPHERWHEEARVHRAREHASASEWKARRDGTATKQASDIGGPGNSTNQIAQRWCNAIVRRQLMCR